MLFKCGTIVSRMCICRVRGRRCRDQDVAFWLFLSDVDGWMDVWFVSFRHCGLVGFVPGE